ncbi:MAG TPA: glycosyltransferase [Opitutaceae bacterium]|nr:glycosyltransferase [Opitutaceae bacterium]
MKIVILGLSYTSSWGNGHATTYRALIRELGARGHEIVFLERDVPWYAEHRDAPSAQPPTRIILYKDFGELRTRHTRTVRGADLVIVGSYVPEGVKVGDWVLENAEGVSAFYDIDTPVTLAQLRQNACTYLRADQIEKYQLYLSFTGGPTLRDLEEEWGSPMARPLYCSVDPKSYFPERQKRRWELGYLGTYSADRQTTLEHLLAATARRCGAARFAVAGSMYPENITWPANVERIAHLAPAQHRSFYNRQRFTLNVTRADMIAAGYSPSVRLFEAAACGTPIISDAWAGLEELFEPGREIIIARSTEDVIETLRRMTPAEVDEMGRAARARVLAEHTAAHRAAELERHLQQLNCVLT